MREVYHSALHDELPIDGRLDDYETRQGLVFQCDLTQGIHPRFRRADAIYSEPAWKDGYAKFAQRAGVPTDQSYAGYLRYLAAIDSIIYELGVPAYVVLGKHMLKWVRPEHTRPVVLHGYEALLGIWFDDREIPGRSNNDVLAWVADGYDCALDFSCGYGNLARAMAERGKRFICSDINPKCVYYVAREVMGYRG